MNIQEKQLAKKYAEAFLQCSGSRLTIEHGKKIEKALSLLKNYTQFVTLLKLPIIASDVKKNILVQWFATLEIPADVTRLFSLLVQHQRLFLFPEVLRHIVLLLYKKNNICTFVVESTIPLTQECVEGIHAFLEHKTGMKIESEYKEEKSLIAGIRLQSSLFLWEYSIRQRLRTIMNML